MSQGDVWQTPDGEKGLEIGRNDKELYLSVINPAWPFPVFPVWYKKSQCRKMPSRYHNNEVVEDAFV